MQKVVVKPTEAELDILQILWRLGPQTVKQVNEILNKKKETGYTTTLKFMQIMTEKDLCTREAEGKLHIYKANIKENQVKRSAVNAMIDKVFEGSAMELVIQTLGNYKATDKELSELKSLIKTMEEESKNQK